MKPPRRLLPYLGIAIPGFGWMIPMFTQLHQKYPALGPIYLYGIALGAVLGIVCSVWFVATGGREGRPLRSLGGTVAIIGVTAVGTGILWVPCINALLDFGPATTVTGTIGRIENPGRGNPSRRVTAVVDGVERSARFDPHDNFWHVAAVRNGGPVELTIRPGFLGIPWVAKFSDP